LLEKSELSVGYVEVLILWNYAGLIFFSEIHQYFSRYNNICSILNELCVIQSNMMCYIWEKVCTEYNYQLLFPKCDGHDFSCIFDAILKVHNLRYWVNRIE